MSHLTRATWIDAVTPAAAPFLDLGCAQALYVVRASKLPVVWVLPCRQLLELPDRRIESGECASSLGVRTTHRTPDPWPRGPEAMTVYSMPWLDWHPTNRVPEARSHAKHSAGALRGCRLPARCASPLRQLVVVLQLVARLSAPPGIEERRRHLLVEPIITVMLSRATWATFSTAQCSAFGPVCGRPGNDPNITASNAPSMEMATTAQPHRDCTLGHQRAQLHSKWNQGFQQTACRCGFQAHA